jgi:hypothetical protein
MTQRLDVHDDHPGGRAPKRRHPWRKLVVTLIVLVGLLVAADFALATAAEYEVSTKLKSQLDLQDDPHVVIHDFPFTTQAIAADYDHVTVDAKGVHLGSFRDLQIHADLDHVHVHISDVLGGTLHEIPIETVKGSIAINADDVGRALAANPVGHRLHLSDLTIDPASIKKVLSTSDTAGNSERGTKKSESQYTRRAGVRLSASTTLAGEKTQVTAFGIIKLRGGAIMIEPKRLALRNDKVTAALPAALQHALLQGFAVTLDPGDLPFGVHALGVAVQPDSVSVKGKATNVVIPLG